MRWVWIIVIGLGLLALEVGVVPHARGLGSGPDLMLLFAVFLSLYGPIEDAPISGWLLGMAKDSMSAGTFGLYAVLFMVLSFFLSRIRADIFLEYNKSHIVNAALATLVVYTGASLWSWAEGSSILAMIPAAAGVCIWNALLAPLVFRLFFRFSRPLEVLRRPR